jgi:hypothetical protein
LALIEAAEGPVPTPVALKATVAAILPRTGSLDEAGLAELPLVFCRPRGVTPQAQVRAEATQTQESRGRSRTLSATLPLLPRPGSPAGFSASWRGILARPRPERPVLHWTCKDVPMLKPGPLKSFLVIAPCTVSLFSLLELYSKVGDGMKG